MLASLGDLPIWDKNSELATLAETDLEHAVAQAGSFVGQQRESRDYQSAPMVASRRTVPPDRQRSSDTAEAKRRSLTAPFFSGASSSRPDTRTRLLETCPSCPKSGR